MGVVYEATDPSLERSVAIKFILRERAGALATQRLRREAVAMAQVSHPNVVTVVDVGEHEGDVFVAMEMIDGITLRTWLDAQPREPEEIRRVFLAAGAGLLAIHRTGLVHRDFKPDNVMLTGQRVVVMDLGLAAIDPDGPASDPEDLAVTATTNVAGVVGTPAYMSPEQFAGRSLDARSDQFSFAVALYEALVGHRPWPSRQLPELVAALETQPPQRIPSEAEVPASTKRALTRALSHDLDDRFDSMDDLIDALDARPARSWAIAASIVALVGTGAALAGASSGEHGCDAGRELTNAWDRSTKQAVTVAFEDYEARHQRDRRDVVLTQLDRYATQWRENYQAACVAAAEGAPHGPAVLGCLADRAAELRGVTGALVSARGAGIDAAIGGVARLAPASGCRDATTRDLGPKQQALRLRATEVLAALQAGSPEPALELLEELEGGGDDSDADTRLLLDASIKRWNGELEPAFALLERRYHALRGTRRDAEAFDTALLLVRLASGGLQDPERAREWRRALEAHDHLRGSDPDERGRYALAVGACLIVELELERAAAVLGSALAEAERDLGQESWIVAELANHLGWVHSEGEDLPRALKAYQRAAELYAISAGLLHPSRARALSNVGYVHAMLGQRERSDTAYHEAFEITTFAYGGHSVQMGRLAYSQSMTLIQIGDWQAAKEGLEFALKLPGADLLPRAREQLAEVERRLAAAPEGAP